MVTLISYDFEARLMPDSDELAGHLVPGDPYYFIVRAKDEFGNIDNNFQEVAVTVYSLDLTVQGAGHVTYDPSGVDCGVSCSEDFLNGTEVNLIASPDQGVDFNGWTGDECTGTGTCKFTIEDNVLVTAEFCKFSTYYKDKDGDGYGDGFDMTDTCTAPAGYVDNSDDCNDADAGINPGAADTPYDGIDQDCSGSDLTDVDGDSYDSTAVGGTDCNDADAGINPGASEECDNVDNNCDGQIDEALSRPTTCGVGQCAGNTGEETCTNGVWDNDTCDPLAGASGETCDGVDNNCDGQTDESYADLGASCSAGLGQCMRTGSFICNGAGNGTECSATPGTPSSTLDACNGIDENCDGQVDEGFIIMLGNNDGYGYGDVSVPDGSLLPQMPVGDQYCSGSGSCSSYTDSASCEAAFNCDWVDWEFDNRDASELAASDGSLYTDNTIYGPSLFFDMAFPASDQWRIKTAKFILDVSGIQTSLEGASNITVDSIDYSSWLPQEQDVFGSAIVEIDVSKVSVRDGYFGVSFEGGTSNGGDAIAIDYFAFRMECY